MAETWLANEGVTAHLHKLEMTEAFPSTLDFFDAVISVQVIHHGTVVSIKRTIQEIERTLKKGGFIFITVPKDRNQGSRFSRIEEGTFVPLDGPEMGLLHHYFTQQELKQFFGNFSITDLHVDASRHYCLSAIER